MTTKRWTTAGPESGRATRLAVLVALACALAGCQRSPEGAKPAATGAGAPAAPSGSPATAAPSSAPNSASSGTTAAIGDVRARDIRDAAAQWPKVEGRWKHGAADSSYVAYFDGGQLRYLEEHATANGAGTNRYYFDGGSLFLFEGAKPSSVPGGEGPGMLPPTVAVFAEFRGNEVIRAVAREHYGEKKLDDAAIAALRAQAAALAGAAQDEWSARQR